MLIHIIYVNRCIVNSPPQSGAGERQKAIIVSKYKKNISAKEHHRKLRGALLARGIEQSDLADVLGISTTSISNRMRGKYPWTVSEAWVILRMIGEGDPSKLGEYFPEGGIHDD